MQKFRHYSGGVYYLLHVGQCAEENEFYAIYSAQEDGTPFGYALHSETRDVYRVYPSGAVDREKSVSLAMREYTDRKGLCICTLESFFADKMLPDGTSVRRFERII